MIQASLIDSVMPNFSISGFTSARFGTIQRNRPAYLKAAVLGLTTIKRARSACANLPLNFSRSGGSCVQSEWGEG
jgi:hypothetical protein